MFTQIGVVFLMIDHLPRSINRSTKLRISYILFKYTGVTQKESELMLWREEFL